MNPDWPDDTLPSMALWLAANMGRVRRHEAAADIVHEVTSAVRQAMRAIDRPPQRVYAGPCPACRADLLTWPGHTTITCAGCGAIHDIAERQEHMRGQLDDHLGTATYAAAILPGIGVHVSAGTIRMWVSRHRLAARATVPAYGAGPEQHLYRLGDIIDLALARDTARAGLAMTAIVLRGDARRLPLPDGSVDLIVTSPPSEVVAYLAGIIDADGCIRISKYKPYRDRATPGYHARTHVRMVEPEAINLLAEIFGGHVWRQKPSLTRGRPLYVWDISDAAAQRALEALLPYLRVKRRQAENALALRRLQSESRQHRTKVTGQRVMVGQYGQRIHVPTKCLSDEFIARCDALYLRAKELNQVGVREEVGGECQ